MHTVRQIVINNNDQRQMLEQNNRLLSICSIKQYILTIKHMIERTLFDQHIQQIKNRYQRITQTTTTTPPDYQFTTPTRNNKHHTPPPLQTALQNHTDNPTLTAQPITRKYSCHRIQARDGNQQQRICLTTRNLTSTHNKQIDEFISEKQTVLKQRMQQNQRLLRKSKQLRNQQSRKNSAEKEIPLPQTHQPRHNKQHPAKENHTGYLTDEKTTLKQRQLSTRSQLESANEKARQMFAQKINQVIDHSFRSKEFTLFNLNEQGKRKEKLSTNVVSFMQSDRQDQDKRQLKMATTTVFDNTAKIQERIKALLSSH